MKIYLKVLRFYLPEIIILLSVIVLSASSEFSSNYKSEINTGVNLDADGIKCDANVMHGLGLMMLC